MNNMSKSKTRSYYVSLVVMSILLLIFWTLIVEGITLGGFFLGLASSGVIVYLFREFVLTKELRFPLNPKNLLRVLTYVGILIKEIIKANIEVAKLVLSPNMNIKPAIVKFRMNVKKETTRVILGNSITLTPGTLTIDIDGCDYVVHGLTKEHAEGPMGWYLCDRLKEMEAEEDDN